MEQLLGQAPAREEVLEALVRHFGLVFGRRMEPAAPSPAGWHFRPPWRDTREYEKIMSDVVMPQMGESIVEGTITKWMKKVGDRVERDEPLFEISTDKVDSEVPSPVAGILEKILVQEGETVEINTLVARMGDGSGGAKNGKKATVTRKKARRKRPKRRLPPPKKPRPKPKPNPRLRKKKSPSQRLKRRITRGRIRKAANAFVPRRWSAGSRKNKASTCVK